MAKLKQIVGAILGDITKAQAFSDAYSRDLKSSYREDPFLKLLSVPRTEITSVTIDMKFAVLRGEQEKVLESNVIFYKEPNYQGSSGEISNNMAQWSSLVYSLKIPKGIKVTLYEQEGFKGRFKSFTEDTPSVGDDVKNPPASIKVEQILMTDIESMEIEVLTNYLTNLPEAAISSISIKLDMTSV